MEGNLLIDGYVEILQDNEVILPYTHNKFVDNGMRGLMSIIATAGLIYDNQPSYDYQWYLPSSDWYIYLGNDSTTPTTPNMTVLTSPIGTAPGTTPNSKNLTARNGSSDGIWNVIYTAIWNPGTVTGTISELGLYMRWPTRIEYKWNLGWSTTYIPATTMGSRLAVADNEFETITIDPTKSVSVNWKIQFAFE